MSIIEALRNTATALGLVRVVDIADRTAPEKIVTRSVTLEDLATELRAHEVQALANLPAELTIDFAQVFSAGGVTTPAHGWSMERLEKFLATAPCQGVPRAEVQKAVLAALAADQAPVEDLVKDAMARDKAIDAFGAFVYQKMQTRRTAETHRKTDLENQIRDLQEQVARLDEEQRLDQRRWHEWWQQKLACERRMADALSYVLDKPVVTIDAAVPGEHNSG